MGAGVWNVLLILGAVLLVTYVYRREGRSRGVKIALGALRLSLLLLVIALLNRPVIGLTQTHTEPSVLAILVDDSISMRVKDAGEEKSRLQNAIELLDGNNQQLLNELRKQHELHLYRFDSSAQPIENVNDLKPEGQTTQVSRSIRSVLEELQGQRLAGVVVLTDGRDTPATPLAESIARVKDFNVKVFPVPLGSDAPPSNVEIQSVSLQDSAFKGDLVNVKVNVRGRGYDAGHVVTLNLKDKRTGRVLTAPDGGEGIEAKVTLNDDKPVEAELQFKADEVGPLDLVVQAAPEPGEIDEEDNVRTAQLSILDAKINVLYVDGYPRWEYRYLKNQMIRDKTVDISCLLTSADPQFRQEGDNPITRFPETLEELMGYDVVVFGDVDPRQFSDSQLALVNEFVAKRGGGFGMVAGPRYSPQQYRGTPIEAILPVNVSAVIEDDPRAAITAGFRPSITKDGEASSIFRFFAERQINDKFLRDDIQPLFWYCKGAIAKPGVGQVYAEHPTETGPDGHKAPLLVVGRFGAGRTLFSGIDDSWRWRYYTGESVFDTYWVQQLRYLARSKKLGQRAYTFASSRAGYELGEQVRLSLRILDPQLLQQLPEQIRVDIGAEEGQGEEERQEEKQVRGASTAPSHDTRPMPLASIRQETLVRQEGQNDLYVATFIADHMGRFVAKLPSVASGASEITLPFVVTVPRLELNEPQLDRPMLSRLALETVGQVIDVRVAREALPRLIASAAKVIPIESSRPLWDAPLALALFVLLITAEWIVRKLYGMV